MKACCSVRKKTASKLYPQNLTDWGGQRNETDFGNVQWTIASKETEDTLKNRSTNFILHFSLKLYYIATPEHSLAVKSRTHRIHTEDSIVDPECFQQRGGSWLAH